MAYAYQFNPASMNASQYTECIARLEAAGAGNPPGRRYHVAYGLPDHIQVFDVWESQEEFERFGETLVPILNALGVDPGMPEIEEIVNTIGR
jgi:hypothetical protein